MNVDVGPKSVVKNCQKFKEILMKKTPIEYCTSGNEHQENLSAQSPTGQKNIPSKTLISPAVIQRPKKQEVGPTAEVFDVNLTPIRGGIERGKVANLRNRFDEIEKDKLLDLKRLQKSSLKTNTPRSKQKKRGRLKPKIFEKSDKNQTLILDFYRSRRGEGSKGGSSDDALN